VSVVITTLVIGLCRSTCTIVTIICVKYTRNWETTLIPSPYTDVSSVDVMCVKVSTEYHKYDDR